MTNYIVKVNNLYVENFWDILGIETVQLSNNSNKAKLFNTHEEAFKLTQKLQGYELRAGAVSVKYIEMINEPSTVVMDIINETK
jgi:hypothetical protein